MGFCLVWGFRGVVLECPRRLNLAASRLYSLIRKLTQQFDMLIRSVELLSNFG